VLEFIYLHRKQSDAKQKTSLVNCKVTHMCVCVCVVILTRMWYLELKEAGFLL